ncbi:MAG: hypothetical protein NTY77_02870 [Elusimicrobia bacterium]|nr:hypothetical protein [Elusimicrobiota bacterium]
MTKKEPKAQPQAEKTVEEMILNYQLDKYSAIPLAALWAKELHRREENRHLTNVEILEKALHDVLGGTVDWKNARKAIAALPAAAVEAGQPGADDGAKKSKA